MRPVWQHMNGFLTRWLMRKYKSLAWHKRRARKTLGRLAEEWPEAFVHWKAGYAPLAE
jgi:RNA-directed DNA polymerase